MEVKEVQVKKVPGKEVCRIMLYALSTCSWCAKARNLLGELGVAYSYVDVDLLDGEAQRNALMQMRRWNPAGSFPTIVINDERCIVGFKEKEIREVVNAK